MDWIRRNPRSAVALSALAVLCAVILALAMSGSSAEDQPSMLGGPSSGTSTPSLAQSTALPSPSGSPRSVEGAPAGFPAAGMGGAGGPGLLGGGYNRGLPRHRVVIAAGSDGPLLGVGWRIPTADGARAGKDLSYRRSFSHTATAYGNPDYAQLYTRVGPNSSTLWCTVTVDGRVTQRQVAHGPWAQVFCQG